MEETKRNSTQRIRRDALASVLFQLPEAKINDAHHSHHLGTCCSSLLTAKLDERFDFTHKHRDLRHSVHHSVQIFYQTHITSNSSGF